MPRDLEGEGKPDLKLRLLALFLVLVLETGGVLVGLFIINQRTEERISQRQTLDQQLDAAQTKAAKAEQSMKDALVFQRQLVAVEAALNQHVYTSKILAYLKKNTLPQVTLTRIQIDVTTGKIGLDLSAQGYRRLGEEIVHLSSLSEISEVRSASVSAVLQEGQQKATASTALILQLDPSVWLGQTSTPVADDKQS
jgi:Tfp pilus assembly protein PilN